MAARPMSIDLCSPQEDDSCSADPSRGPTNERPAGRRHSLAPAPREAAAGETARSHPKAGVWLSPDPPMRAVG